MDIFLYDLFVLFFRNGTNIRFANGYHLYEDNTGRFINFIYEPSLHDYFDYPLHYCSIICPLRLSYQDTLFLYNYNTTTERARLLVFLLNFNTLA